MDRRPTGAVDQSRVRQTPSHWGAVKGAPNWVRQSFAGLCQCVGKARCAGMAAGISTRRNAANTPAQAYPSEPSEGIRLEVASTRHGNTTSSRMRLDPGDL